MNSDEIINSIIKPFVIEQPYEVHGEFYMSSSNNTNTKNIKKEHIMKVYVVTSGTYSDYMIRKIFLDKDKAEEYRKWIPDSNDIEEYDTSDNDVIDKQYYIRVDLKWYTNKKENLIARSWKDCESNYNYNYYSNYNNIWEQLTVVRTVNADEYDEQWFKDRLTKHIYDLKAHVEYLKTEGYNEKQIRDTIALKPEMV